MSNMLRKSEGKKENKKNIWQRIVNRGNYIIVKPVRKL